MVEIIRSHQVGNGRGADACNPQIRNTHIHALGAWENIVMGIAFISGLQTCLWLSSAVSTKMLPNMRLMWTVCFSLYHTHINTHTHTLKLHGPSRSVNRQRWCACVSDRAIKWLYKHDKLFPNIITSAESICISSLYTETGIQICSPELQLYDLSKYWDITANQRFPFTFIWPFIIRIIYQSRDL